MMRLGYAQQIRVEGGAYGTCIGCSVGMAAYRTINWAMVEARSAADAAQGCLRRGSQKSRSTVVDQNNVKLTWAIRKFLRMRSAHHADI